MTPFNRVASTPLSALAGSVASMVGRSRRVRGGGGFFRLLPLGRSPAGAGGRVAEVLTPTHGGRRREYV